MIGMSVVPLGVGDAFSALYYSACLAVECDGAWLLVDCPHPIRKMMREASRAASVQLDIDNVQAIALTHLHADHASGLEDFAYYSHFFLQRKTVLATHPQVAENLWSGHLSASMGQLRGMPGMPLQTKQLDDYMNLVLLDEHASVQIGPFTLECRKTIHPIPTFAFRIHAAGRSLGCSADTSFDPALLAWLLEADTVVHETNHGIHTPYETLAALPESTRKKLRLIHYPDTFDLQASVITPLREGVRYDV